MNDNASYRQYLQYHDLNNPGAARRAEAQALLNVTGDDGGLNGYFLMGQKKQAYRLNLLQKHFS
jgi:hypothetical protein